MAELPIKAEPEVQSAPASAPYTEGAAPDLSGVARGLAQVQELYERTRALNAQFAADEADLDFSKQASQMWARFREQHGMAPTEKLGEAQAELEKMRKETGRKLGDPLARRAFEAASRRRLEGHLEKMELYASAERERYQGEVTDGKIEDAYNTIREGWLDNAKIVEGIQKAIGANEQYWGGVRGLPEEQLNAKSHQLMVKGVEAALGEAAGAGVGDPAAAQAGLKLLYGKLNFGGKEVDVSELLGARAKFWEGKLKESKADGTGVALGVQAYDSGRGEGWLRAQLRAKTIDEVTFAKAMAQYSSLAGQAHTRQQIFEEQQFKSAAAHLADAGWDMEKYKAGFGREYLALGGDRAKLQALADSMGKKGFNEDQERAWARALDSMGAPGWSDGKRLETYLKELAPTLGPQHWDEFTREFQKDRNRSTEQDGNTAVILGALDTRLRKMFKVEKSNGREWDSADIEHINARNWAVAQMQRLVATHHDQTRKQGAAGTDPTWYMEPMDKIIEQARTMAKTKARPATPGFNKPPPPRAAANKITRTDPTTGETREWDGKSWVPLTGGN